MRITNSFLFKLFQAQERRLDYFGKELAALEGKVVTPSASNNIPMAEIAWCKEAFKIAMKHSVDNNYREMWRTRLNAVVAQLRHR